MNQIFIRKQFNLCQILLIVVTFALTKNICERGGRSKTFPDTGSEKESFTKTFSSLKGLMTISLNKFFNKFEKKRCLYFKF